jgi:hypothetical protein
VAVRVDRRGRAFHFETHAAADFAIGRAGEVVHQRFDVHRRRRGTSAALDGRLDAAEDFRIERQTEHRFRREREIGRVRLGHDRGARVRELRRRLRGAELRRFGGDDCRLCRRRRWRHRRGRRRRRRNGANHATDHTTHHTTHHGAISLLLDAAFDSLVAARRRVRGGGTLAARGHRRDVVVRKRHRRRRG